MCCDLTPPWTQVVLIKYQYRVQLKLVQYNVSYCYSVIKFCSVDDAGMFFLSRSRRFGPVRAFVRSSRDVSTGTTSGQAGREVFLPPLFASLKKQYVGETENALHIRMNGHRSDIKHRRLEKPVAKGHSLEDLSIFVSEQIHREEANFRRAKENYWIQTVQSLAPEGLNLDP